MKYVININLSKINLYIYMIIFVIFILFDKYFFIHFIAHTQKKSWTYTTIVKFNTRPVFANYYKIM